MIDVIIHVADFPALVGYLDTNAPHMLARDENGEMSMPPVVTGFARTPATMGSDGNSLMVYARLSDEEVLAWSDMPHVEVLARVPFTGAGTGQEVYNQVFNNSTKLTKYKYVYDFTPYETTDDSGETFTITPPEMFGMIAGA